jgi:hypothetical protein
MRQILLRLGVCACLQYAKVAQPLSELPEPRKMDHRLVALRAKKWRMLAVCTIVWHIAAASARYAKVLCAICQSRGSRRRVLAKYAVSGEPVFTLMDALLYGPLL